MSKVKLETIELDTSIQCRAAINTGIVNEYAERMGAGDKFPKLVLFGSHLKAWIGDGWHRVLAGKQIGAVAMDADLRPGGRQDALRHALSANALHGHRRTNADKRRCVEIALREFAKFSNRTIAKMCGVSPSLVDVARPQVPDSGTSSERTGADGKTYPAKKTASKNSGENAGGDGEAGRDQSRSEEPVATGHPSLGMQYARMAVLDLESIAPDDCERAEAFAYVKGWLEDHGAQTAATRPGLAGNGGQRGTDGKGAEAEGREGGADGGFKCSTCDGTYPEDELVEVRECPLCGDERFDSSETEQHCPTCNRPFTRLITRAGCPVCLDDEALTEHPLGAA